MAEAKQLVGSVLSETYRLERLLGEGGMGAVYEAAHLRLDRRFAIKVLLESSASGAEMMARFQREARITSGIGHPNIVEVTDFQHMPDGTPYIVMELLEGEDLGVRMQRQGRFELQEAASILEQAAAGIQAAHDKGIVHRDLKPQNIFLCRGAEGLLVKVLDFGISKVLTTKSRLTRTRALLGTPYYMSPEQAEQRQGAIGVQTDVWAMGTIMFEMVAGTPPFEGDSVPSLLYTIVHKPPPRLQELRPEVPEPVRFVIEKAISKRPEDRYASILEFAEEFDQALQVTRRAEAPAALEDTQPALRAVTDDLDVSNLPALYDRTVPEAPLPPPEAWDEEPAPPAEAPAPPHPTAEPPALPAEVEPELRPAVEAVSRPTPTAVPAREEPPKEEPIEPARQMGQQAKLTTMSLGAGEVLQRIRASVGWWGIAAFAVVVVGGLASLLYGLLRTGQPTQVQVAATAGQNQVPALPAPRTSQLGAGPAAQPAPRATRLLWVSSKPAGAEVFLDGRPIGVTPIKGIPVSRDGATLKVTAAGYESWTKSVDKGEDRVALHVVLKAQRRTRPAQARRQPRAHRRTRPDKRVHTGAVSTLRIITVSRGVSIWADVYLDGRAVGQSPKVVKNLRPGQHAVHVRRDGYRPRTLRLRLGSGQNKKLNIEMERADAKP